MESTNIVIDGMDGAGKTTLVRALEIALEKKGKKVGHQAFPTHHRAIGQLIRESFNLTDMIHSKAMLPLFIADGMDADEELVERSLECEYLICDRHPMITAWAYQAGDHSVATLAAMTNPGAFDFIPDAVFIVDVPAEVAMLRRAKRDEKTNELFEKGLEHTNMLRTRFQAFAGMYSGNGPVMLLDGTLSTEELVDGILKVLQVS